MPMSAREHRVLIPARPEEVFAFVSKAANVPLFAPGVEEATLVGGAEGLQGAFLGLRTRSGRELRAQVTHFHDNESWTVVDEHETVSQIQVEPAPGGTLLTATLMGVWRPDIERAIADEWERKLAELPQQFARAPAARAR